MMSGDYVNVSRAAIAFGIRAAVLLDQRLVTEFSELDVSLGEDTTGVILSLLAYHLQTGHIGDAGRLPVCLMRNDDRQWVEVDLLVIRHDRDSGQRFYLRIAGVRELASPTFN